MKRKKELIVFLLSAAAFIIGGILVNLNTGKVGVLGFSGYILCTAAILALIFDAAVYIVLKGEEKKDEK